MIHVGEEGSASVDGVVSEVCQSCVCVKSWRAGGSVCHVVLHKTGLGGALGGKQK